MLLWLLACSPEPPTTAPAPAQADTAPTVTDDTAAGDTGAPSPPEPAPTNLLDNPGFSDGSGDLPSSWSRYGTGEIDWSSGRVSLGGPSFALLYQRVPATAGSRYTASAWATSADGTSDAALKLEFHDASEQKISESVWPLSAPEGGGRFTLAAVAPEGTALATVALYGVGEPRSVFDDAALYDTTPGPIPELVFDLDEVGQVFDGMGAQIWGYAADTDTLSDALVGLNIRRVRIENVWETATDAQLQETATLTSALGISWLYMAWAEPGAFSQGGVLTDPEGFGVWWAGEVAALDALGIRPAHIELMNEPDSGGAWSTGISPEDYRTLVVATRRALDSAGFGDVGIVGPGTAAFDWGHGARDRILALDSEAADAIAAWSAHAWDDDGSCADSAACLGRAWRDFADAARDRGRQPLWVTEYATKATVFGGADWPAPDQSGTFNATESVGYAVRVYANTLALLNAGTSAPFLWQLVDEPTEVYGKDKGWGLVRLDGSPKPAYEALAPLAGALPVGGRVLSAPVQDGLGVVAAVVASDGTIVIGLANPTDAAVEARVRLRDNRGPLVVSGATLFAQDDPGDPSAQQPGTATVEAATVALEHGKAGWTLPVSLPAQATLTVSLERR